jgi:hypothetical protein
MVLPELSIIIGNEVKFVLRRNQATKLSVFLGEIMSSFQDIISREGAKTRSLIKKLRVKTLLSYT